MGSTDVRHDPLCAVHGFTGQCSCGADPKSFFHDNPLPSHRLSADAMRHLNIVAELVNERIRQRDEFTIESDDNLTPAEWVARIVKHLGRVVTTEPDVYRKQLVVLGALAVAALEAHDRKYGLELE